MTETVSYIPKDKKAGIICAMQLEADGIISEMTDKSIYPVSGITFTRGKIGGRDVIVAVCGIGKVFASLCAEAMIISFSPDFIINTGVAGGLGDGLKIGDTVVAAALVQHDMDTSPLGDPKGLISGINIIELPTDDGVRAAICSSAEEIGYTARTGIIASGDRFIASDSDRISIKEEFGALACEMEGGAVAQVCYVNRIPCGVLRAISDSGDGDAVDDYPAFARDAALRAAKIILKVLA